MTLEVKAPLPVTLGNASALETAYELDVQTFGHQKAEHVRDQLAHALVVASGRMGPLSLGHEARIALDTLVNVAIPESESNCANYSHIKRSCLRQCALDLSTNIIAAELASKVSQRETSQLSTPVNRSEHLDQIIESLPWHSCSLDQALTCANLIMSQSYASHEHGIAVCKRLTVSVLNAGIHIDAATKQQLTQFLDLLCDSLEHPVNGAQPLTALAAKNALLRISRWPDGIIQPEHVAILATPVFRDAHPTADSVRSLFLALAHIPGTALSTDLSTQAKEAAMRLPHPFNSDLLLFASVTNRWPPDTRQYEFGIYLLNNLLQMDVRQFGATGPLEVKDVTFSAKPPPGYSIADYFECLSKIIDQTPELRFQPAATASLFLMLSHFDPNSVPTSYLNSLDKLVENLGFHIPDTIFCDLAYGLKNFQPHTLPKYMWQHIFSKFGFENECSNKVQLLKLCSGMQDVAWRHAPPTIRNYIQNSVARIIEQGNFDEYVVAAVLKSVWGSNSIDPTRPLFDLISAELPALYNWSPSLITDALAPLSGLALENVGEAFFEGMILAVSRTTTPFTRRETAAILQALRNFEGPYVNELIDLVASRTPPFDTPIPNKLECIRSLVGLIGRADTPAIQNLRAHFLKLYSESQGKREKPKILLAECHSLTMLNLPWDADLRSRYEAWLQRGPLLGEGMSQSPYEIDLFNKLHEHFPHLEIRQNVFVDGIELDVYIPALNLNIEVDGIQHMGKQRVDRIRDARLQETYQIETLRIRSFSDSFDISLNAIFDQVNKRLLN